MKVKSLWQVIFILIILYSASSMNVLILAKSILPYMEGAFLKTQVLEYFAHISFILAAFLCGFHIVNMFGRGKKQTEPEEQNGY